MKNIEENNESNNGSGMSRRYFVTKAEILGAGLAIAPHVLNLPAFTYCPWIGWRPQTVLGFFANTIREHLEVSADHKLLFGISFGFEDRSARASYIIMDRDSIQSSVIFHS